MKIKHIVILIISLVLFLFLISLVFNYIKVSSVKNETAITVAELLKNPVYDKTVKILGEVSYLGETNQFREIPECPCLSLYSDGGVVNVWHDGMKIFGPIERPSANIKEISNGEKVIIIGELKSEDKDKQFKNFWARKIEKIK